MNIKFGNSRMSLFNPFLIFILSLLSCLFVLVTERALGIGLNFHPDANTYLTLGKDIALADFNFRFLFGNSFYVLVSLFDSIIWQVLAFNIFLYSLTNVLLATFFDKNFSSNSFLIWFLILLVIFNPYRLHLAVHVLKDTIIIFGLIGFLTLSRVYSWIFMIISYSASIRTLIYLVSFINKKTFILAIMPVIVFIFIQKDGFLYSIINIENQVNMTFRDFDKVPNFFEYGILGALLRAIIWPFLFLTGLFIFFSPSIMYLPIAFGSFCLQFWHIICFRKLAFLFPIYLSMSVLAYMVSGFTSFIRYSLPLLTILPVMVLYKNNKQPKVYLNMDNQNDR
ncbi:hypothetical protein [Candidatus Pseudothioglobus singularis]|uniref:Uncharacterized protein n=1 Tax=Candidatus Pseudothioglobus singularis PS1 TaxID=1125411 RepID=A0A0M3T2H9_9GAMM|nr:hypothetical protein [Candidatus Pseudothioglobus singularis]ALE02765.1 hypothetical protein W908_06985 [Candidatus Pseudothioglobus singularis PS1]